MAIDSARKRAAMLNFGPLPMMLPIPDGTLALDDRWQLLGLYLLSAGGTLTYVVVPSEDPKVIRQSLQKLNLLLADIDDRLTDGGH